jgi:oxygen-independent coproporphyrinogen-3 oxidase
MKAFPHQTPSGEVWQTGGFGLYIHWPFCESKCPYCDFNSHVAGKIDQSAWLEAYRSELRRQAAETQGRILQTVYFGGGTPSLMSQEVVAGLIDCVREHWQTVNDIEITLEANPSSVESTRFEGYHPGGVNRVSLGVQALDDAALQALGRLHSKRQALKALEIAKGTFDRVSFDLIYSRQFQSLDDWRTELSEALALAGDHISLYQLTVEDGTMFAARAARGKLAGLPNEDLSADMYEITQEMCNAAGLPAYEVSNHARPGAESRHNLIYWRGGDYIGIGPGAHGRFSKNQVRHATEAWKDPTAWLNAVSSGRGGDRLRDQLAPDEIALEYMLMSLRTNEGLDLDRHAAMAGRGIPESRLATLSDLGLVHCTEGRLKTTPAGRMVLNSVLKDLVSD